MNVNAAFPFMDIYPCLPVQDENPILLLGIGKPSSHVTENVVRIHRFHVSQIWTGTSQSQDRNWKHYSDLLSTIMHEVRKK